MSGVSCCGGIEKLLGDWPTRTAMACCARARCVALSSNNAPAEPSCVWARSTSRMLPILPLRRICVMLSAVW